MANDGSRYRTEVATVEAARMMGGGYPDGSGGHAVAPERPCSERAAIGVLRERSRFGQEHSIHRDPPPGQFHCIAGGSHDRLEKRRGAVSAGTGIAVASRN